jgi:hypothetical protein
VIIEGTSYGHSFEVAPSLDWKEWGWNLAHITALGAEAGIVGVAVQQIGLSDSWIPTAVGTFVAFPFVLLGALAADGAWAPLAIVTVLRTFVPLLRAWGLFYLQTGIMAVAWTALTWAGLDGPAPWLTPVYAGPLLAALLLIYARLIGRLAARIMAATESPEDDDEG